MPRAELKSRNPRAPFREQTFYCSECGKEFKPAPAFGSKHTRPMVTALNSRFEKHRASHNPLGPQT